MYSAPSDRRWFRHFLNPAAGVLCLPLLVLIFLSQPNLATAQASGLDIPPASAPKEAWLVTYSPGDIYWQRFGHNAIWIRDAASGIDHTFNFGFFDFQQDRFISRFIQGRMLYFAVAQRAADEFQQYHFENRSISAQRLELAPDAFEQLSTYLLEQVQPANRNYLYDYYLNNCSTRVRDALDLALGGAIKDRYSGQVAGQNFRAHTRRSTSMDFWYYLVLEAALGLPVDQSISRWDEMFLPSVVADLVSELEIDGTALAGERLYIYRANIELPPATAPAVWLQYLLFSVLLTAFFLGLCRLAGPLLAGGSALAWLLVTATGGLVLAGLWFFTDHAVANPNANLLLLNPLALLGLWPALRRFASILIIGGLLLAAIQALVPSGQYNLDLLAFIAPLNAACAYWLWRQPLMLKDGLK